MPKPSRPNNIRYLARPLQRPIKRPGAHAHPLRAFLNEEGKPAIRGIREIMGFSRKEMASLYGITYNSLVAMEAPGGMGVTARYYLWLEHLYGLWKEGKFK